MNFSRAAEKLNIAQSTLSQYLQKLEDELGIKLFERTTVALRLTEYGRIYVKGAKQILELYAQITGNIEDVKLGTSGTVRMGISPSRAPYVLPFAVKKFKEEYPDVRFNFVEAKSDEILKMLDDGDIDFAYTVRSSDMSSRDYDIIFVETEEIMLVTAKNSVLLDGIVKNGTVDYKDLKDIDFVVLENNQLLASDFAGLSRKTGVKPNAVITVSELSTALSMVMQNLGVTLLPSSYIHYGSLAKDLDFITILPEKEKREIVIVTKKNKYISSAAKKLISEFTKKTC